MTEYIDRHEAVVVVSRPALTRAELRRFICKIPAADVREVVRGHWNYKCPIDGTSYRYCSNCLGIIYDSDVVIPKNFCPNCGADMREDKA